MLSVAIPVLSAFGFLFFFIRFYLEKYNMIYVYCKEFEAVGRLRGQIIPIQLISIFLSQIVNISFLRVYSGHTEMSFIGSFFVIVEVSLLIIIYIRKVRNEDRIVNNL
jgi:hypothetical protein